MYVNMAFTITWFVGIISLASDNFSLQEDGNPVVRFRPDALEGPAG